MSTSAETIDMRQEQDQINNWMKRIDDAYDRAASNAGLTPSRFDILYALRESEGLTQKQICDESYTGKQTINAAIHKMEQEGLLRFEPGPGRSKLVYLTASGRALEETVIDPIFHAECDTLQALGEDDRRMFMRLLSRYTDALVGRLDALPLQ